MFISASLVNKPAEVYFASSSMVSSLLVPNPPSRKKEKGVVAAWVCCHRSSRKQQNHGCTVVGSRKGSAPLLVSLFRERRRKKVNRLEKSKLLGWDDKFSLD